MAVISRRAAAWRQQYSNGKGFTLVEMLIAMAVGLTALSVMVSVYTVQQAFYSRQQSILHAQQNIRSALVILEQQIRLAGFDPEGTGRFAITDVRRYDTVGTQPSLQGQPALFYTADMDENGALDSRNHYRNRENLNFRIRDDQNTGRRYLAFDMGGGRQPVAENIQSLGLAYAVDVDGDGSPDTWDGGAHLIWAVDTDNDNRLDTHLDTNDDGAIDASDDRDGDLKITPADGGQLNPPIAVARICAVRIWLLATAESPNRNAVARSAYVVGDRIVAGSGDRSSRLLLESIVQCRNL
jgi:type IV pilus assembly protein PilW